MITVEASVEIKKPISEVFEMASDPFNQAKWNHHEGLSDIKKLTSGPLGAGSKYQAKSKDAGHIEVEYLQVEKDKLFEQALDIQYGKIIHRAQFSKTKTGTLLNHSLTIEPKGMYKLMSAVIKGVAHKRLEHIGILLKEYMEK